MPRFQTGSRGSEAWIAPRRSPVRAPLAPSLVKAFRASVPVRGGRLVSGLVSRSCPLSLQSVRRQGRWPSLGCLALPVVDGVRTPDDDPVVSEPPDRELVAVRIDGDCWISLRRKDEIARDRVALVRD